MRHVLISPHMDDTVFSSCDYILSLIDKRKAVVVITVFTNFGKEPISWHSRRYLKCMGILHLKTLFQLRKREDRKAMYRLGVKNFSHLGFIDAGFRKRQDVTFFANLLAILGVGPKFLYPYHDTRSLYTGKIAREDHNLANDVYKELKKIIQTDDIIYIPMGIGKHADHIIVKRAANRLKNKKYYWLDQFYANKAYTLKEQKNILKKYKIFKKFGTTKEKLKIAKCYKSQVRCIFPKGVNLKKEIIYEEKN